MANEETKQLDSVIASRRAMLLGTGAAALAAAFLPEKAKAASTVTTYTDADILNFALNLEYLEANFYYLAAFGCTIFAPNAAALAANGNVTIPITSGTGAAGGTVLAPTTTKVPFTIPAVAAYAIETAVEEGKHVLFLRNALTTMAVAMPNLDLNTSFANLAVAAGVPAKFLPFSPYAGDVQFLAGAYIFEDVGVTAYHGAAPHLTVKGNLGAAASILAVEAYHAGLVRTTINGVDPADANQYIDITTKVSALRASLSRSALAATNPPYAYPTGTYGDDIPLTPTTSTSISTTNTVSLNGTSVGATTIVDADLTTNGSLALATPGTVQAFSRTTTQVLNIVTGGNATTAGTKAQGIFFPNGLNGLFT